MLIKTMTQYANEAWESWPVVSSFVSPAEVFNRQDAFLDFRKIQVFDKIEQQRQKLVVLSAHLEVSKCGILMN